MVQITPPHHTPATIRSQFGAFKSFIANKSVLFDTQQEAQALVNAVNSNPRLGYALSKIGANNNDNVTDYIQDHSYAKEDFKAQGMSHCYGDYGVFLSSGDPKEFEKTFNLVKGQEYKGFDVNA